MYKTVTVPVGLANSPNAQVAVTTVALSTVTVFGSEPNSALATIVISPDAEQSSTAAISSSENSFDASLVKRWTHLYTNTGKSLQL